MYKQKAKMKQNKTLKGSKGITLIALVITIIVLLILAGIAIASLTGENGILSQATRAGEETSKGTAEEEVKAAVLGSYDKTGKIDMDELNDNLREISKLTYNGKPIDEKGTASGNRIETLPATVELSGYNIIINADGSVKEMPKEIADIIANPKEYYGRKVTNYKASDDDENTYRIFYVDEKGEFGTPNTIYLKADYSSSTYDLSNYSSYDVMNTKVREMNPNWAKQRGRHEGDWMQNEKAAAYLCSPVNATNQGSTTNLPWKDYYDGNAAEFVIGGPSIEMYVKSYNEAYTGVTLENRTIYTLGAKRDSYGYKYTVDGAEQNNGSYTNIETLDYSKFNSMYCGKNASKQGYWWLASPNGFNGGQVCNVDYFKARLFAQSCGARCAISPLVSLKSNFIPQVEE